MSNVATHEHPGQGHGPETHFNLIVNGRPKQFDADEITFAQVVGLAFDQINENTVYTVTYKRGPKENPEGTMSSGDKVAVKSGMVFNVTATDKS